MIKFTPNLDTRWGRVYQSYDADTPIIGYGITHNFQCSITNLNMHKTGQTNYCPFKIFYCLIPSH